MSYVYHVLLHLCINQYVCDSHPQMMQSCDIYLKMFT